MTSQLKRAVAEVAEADWQELKDGQQWADVCFVPQEIAHSKRGREYRYLVVREPLRQWALPGLEEPLVPAPAT